MKSTPGAQVNHSILDGFTILQAVVTSAKPVGGIEISRQLQLESTRVNRLLKTLASIGMVQQTTNRKYTAGPGIHVLATQSLYASGLLQCSIPSLESLATLNLTVAMGVLWQDSVSFIYHAKPGMSSSQGIGRIGLRPATNSGIGMVLLANKPEQSILELYQDKPIINFSNDVHLLQTRLEQIKQDGFARTNALDPKTGRTTEQCTIAVPIGRPINSAIAVSGLIPIEQTQAIVDHLLVAKQAIELELSRLKSNL